MNKKIYIFLIIVGLVLVVGFIFYRGNSAKQPANSNSNNPVLTQNSSTAQKFTDQPYAKNAFLISGDSLSSDAQNALSGFKMDKQNLPDGTVKINLTAAQPGYKDQQFTLKTGEQLYFIEKFMGDDPNGQENNLVDDLGVIVDSQGNVVQAPANLQN